VWLCQGDQKQNQKNIASSNVLRKMAFSEKLSFVSLAVEVEKNRLHMSFYI
jgi:hypothetical protein